MQEPLQNLMVQICITVSCCLKSIMPKAPHTYISCTLQLHSHGQHMIEHLAIYQFLTLKYSEAIRTLLQPSCICNLIKMQS
jgi:hypothetical protein